ncbi:MAG: sulfite exporter TauE/SafE family protein [Candidatus Magasanikbacteria bacterium]|nr:sulfite exporter TauE/SafE family protein [Candidatus Magasanikbacteria bacterium]
MSTLKVPIRGMHCASCEILIGESVRKVPRVAEVRVDQHRGLATIQYHGEPPSGEAIRQAVQDAGYDVGQKDKLPWISTNPRDYKDLLRAAGILFVIYLIAKWLNLFSLDVGAQNTGVIVALFVGLIAGVSTCMALVGGLVLSLSARHAELHPEATTFQKFRPHIYFNIGRIVGFALLGGFVGLIGAAFRPSSNILAFLTVVIGGVMIFFGLKLVEVFPILKDKSITLPSGVARLFGLHKEVKEYSPKSSMVMGALTFFLPCGFTQAMQLYAVSTGSFWQGMAIMTLFAVGTAPGLLGVGGLTSIFKGRKARIFFMTAGLAVIILGWINIVNGSHLFGSSSGEKNSTVSNAEVQEVRMTQSGGGYSPNTFTVEKGKPVKWIIKSTSPFSCAASIVMPKYGINQGLRSGENIIKFTPTEVGEIPFSCSMGMYRGKFIVIEPKGGPVSAGNVAQAATLSAQQSGTASCGAGGCGGCGGGARKATTPQVGVVQTEPSSSNVQDKIQVLKSVYTYEKDMVPNIFTVKKGQRVRLEIDVRDNGQGCMSTVVIPGLYDQVYQLTAGQKIVMEFTPTAIGDYPITCAMGVPRGEIKVIN